MKNIKTMMARPAICATCRMCVTINCSPALQTYVHFCYDLLLRSDSLLFKKSLLSKKGTLRSCFRLCGFALTISTTVMTTTLYNYCKPLSTHSMLNSITLATNNVQLEENSHIFTYRSPDTWNKPCRINSGLV